MKLKAKQQLHVSSVRADTIRAGEEFEVSEPIGKSLVQRGLASRVGAKKAKAKPKNKRAAAPQNKQAPAPENKSEPSKPKDAEDGSPASETDKPASAVTDGAQASGDADGASGSSSD